MIGHPDPVVVSAPARNVDYTPMFGWLGFCSVTIACILLLGMEFLLLMLEVA